MRAETKIIDKVNLTVVFVALDKDLVRRDIIKRMFKDEDLQILEIPEALIIDFKDRNNNQAVYLNRRLQISAPFDNPEETAEFLAIACEIFLEAAPNEVVAYGFNLEGRFVTPDFNYNEHLIDVCYDGGTKLSQKLGSEIDSVQPGFSFRKFDARFNVSLRPVEEEQFTHLDFHCNIHFEKMIPTKDLIIEQFPRYLGYLDNIIEML